MASEKRLIDANAKFIEKHFTKRLIDGFALVDTVEDICWYHVNAKGELVDGANTAHNIPLYKASDIYDAINNAPTVDAVEVVHGRWERCGGDLHSSGYAIFCSVCNKVHFVHYKYSLGGLACKVYSREPRCLYPGSRYKFDTGVHVAIPAGSIAVILHNQGRDVAHIKQGQKIGQLLIQPIVHPELVLVDELEETERGSGGFGSTGKF